MKIQIIHDIFAQILTDYGDVPSVKIKLMPDGCISVAFGDFGSSRNYQVSAETWDNMVQAVESLRKEAIRKELL